jgi:hypothetical protein
MPPAIVKPQSILGTSKDVEQGQAAPDVSSDRVPATDTKPEGGSSRVKSPPLAIREIENLEDDAKGG